MKMILSRMGRWVDLTQVSNVEVQHDQVQIDGGDPLVHHIIECLPGYAQTVFHEICISAGLDPATGKRKPQYKLSTRADGSIYNPNGVMIADFGYSGEVQAKILVDELNRLLDQIPDE